MNRTRLFHLVTLVLAALIFSNFMTLAKAESKFEKVNSAASKSSSEDVSSFPAGAGTQFLMTKGTDKNEIKVYFLKSSDANTVLFEVNLKSLTDSESLQISMDQQFEMKKIGGTFQITKGIIKIPQVPKPQILPDSTLSGLSGVQTKSFLLGSMKEIDGLKIGSENIQTNGKSFQTTHYRKIENGQTVDFWISPDAKPMGLVKLVSRGSTPDFSYELLYQKTLTGMTKKIETSEAVPLEGASELLLDFMSPKK